jgi:hypothetical protein
MVWCRKKINFGGFCLPTPRSRPPRGGANGGKHLSVPDDNDGGQRSYFPLTLTLSPIGGEGIKYNCVSAQINNLNENRVIASKEEIIGTHSGREKKCLQAEPGSKSAFPGRILGTRKKSQIP